MKDTADTLPNDADDLVVRYACGQLTLTESARLQETLRTDPNLAQEASGLKTAFDAIGTAAALMPPPLMRQRVMDAVAKRLESNVLPMPPRQHGPMRRRWTLAVMASLATAASVAVAVLLVERNQLRHELELQLQAAAMLHEPNVVLSFALHGDGSMRDARGVVLLDLDARRASIALQSLPALSDGQSYHLWAVLEDKQVPCGRFQRDAQGRIVTQFAIPVDSYSSPIQKLIMTVEPDVDLPAPRGPAVMSS